MKKTFLLLTVLVSLVVAPLRAQTQAVVGAGAAKPKLVVVLVLDQFRAEYLTRYAPYFGKGGFKWLMRHEFGVRVKTA